MSAWYAKHFGIGDQDILEAAWLKDWVQRHHNSLEYNFAAMRWFWRD